ncbi:prolyl-tRNA synthetase [Patescibacteria group bacterium]|nr:prolyl-tRNA synthetase [Patescibacteria group bacterium]
MLYSKLFGKTSKTAPADADSVNARLLTQAGFVSKQMAGVYNYLPLGLRVLNNIQNIIREEMNMIGGNELLMPTLTQEENYKETGRDVAMSDVLFSTEGAGGAKIYLNPTHEEVITPLVQKFVFSYKDLPLAVYQIQNKFRNEARAKSGLLRGREFSMKDLYSFHANEEDLNRYYEIVKDAYFKIYNRLGIGDITYLTFASGGTFSRYSHEFQTVCDIGEDLIYVCEKCHVAVNKEIIEEQNQCPECGNQDLVTKNAVEVGNIFKQKTKFTSAFKFLYKDENDAEQPVEMAAYGIGPSRVMGTLAEIFHDDKGIIWPESVAPFKVHLLALGKEDEAKNEAKKIYEELSAKGVEVLYDDRDNVSAGAKMADADLIGIPYRVVVSKKTLAQGAVELKKRNEDDVEIIKIDEIVSSF